MRAFLLTLLLLTSPARAASFYVVDGLDGRPAARIWGDMEDGDNIKFSDFLKSHPRVYSIIIDGEGGLLYPATKIGVFARAAQMPVAVAAGKECDSACAFLWAASPYRILEPGARVGFHGVFRIVDGKVAATSDGNAFVGAYLARLGFDDEAIRYMTSRPPTEMEWLDEKAAHEHGLDYVVMSDHKPRPKFVPPSE